MSKKSYQRELTHEQNELVEQIMAQVIARVATPEQRFSRKPLIKYERRLWQKKADVNRICWHRYWRHCRSGHCEVDSALLDAMKLEKRYRSIGIWGRVLAQGHTLWPLMKR